MGRNVISMLNAKLLPFWGRLYVNKTMTAWEEQSVVKSLSLSLSQHGGKAILLNADIKL